MAVNFLNAIKQKTGENTFVELKLNAAAVRTGGTADAPVYLNTSLSNITSAINTNAEEIGKVKTTAEAALPKAGGTMTGELILKGAPTQDLEAATKKYVDEAEADALEAAKAYADGILAANDAMTFKGTIGEGGTVTALPAEHTVGDTYKVITAGTYAGQVCEIGDLIIASSTSEWVVVQSNIDGAVTGPVSSENLNIAVFDGTSGKLIADGGKTIQELVNDLTHPTFTTTETTNGSKALEHAEAFTVVDSVTTGDNGHVTGYNVKTLTLPAGYVHPAQEVTPGTAAAEAPDHGASFTVLKSVSANAQGHLTGYQTVEVTLPAAYVHPDKTVATETANQTPVYAGSFDVVKAVEYDAQGHVSKYVTGTVTLPSAPGATDAVAGVTKLSDAIDGAQTAAADGTAATPKAVSDAVAAAATDAGQKADAAEAAAKGYADELNNAMDERVEALETAAALDHHAVSASEPTNLAIGGIWFQTEA